MTLYKPIILDFGCAKLLKLIQEKTESFLELFLTRPDPPNQPFMVSPLWSEMWDMETCGLGWVVGINLFNIPEGFPKRSRRDLFGNPSESQITSNNYYL